MKKVIILIFTLLIIVGITGCGSFKDNNKITILTTSFPSYDFARAITKDSDLIEVEMLLKPGAETHDFEPTPKDIKNIKNSDIFIYVGGDSDNWIDNILDDINLNQTKIIKLMDLVATVEEEVIEGMEEHEEGKEEIEYDEHVWTSPVNAITIINKLKDIIIDIDKKNKKLYENNAEIYINEIENIDKEIRDVVNTAKRKEIIFGDRFPFRYFVDTYGLTYYAAFPGCSEQTEASAKTIAFLINKIKEDKIPVIFKIELSSGKIAEQIAQETKAKVLEFNSAHNISANDFNNSVTYIDIMKNNIEVLREALN